MAKSGAIPHGYMTVGEIAKKMGTTVRTLQYYDRQGLLSPSAESEGGRRLYTDKDLVRLYQILSLKQLGFSLDDIKVRLMSLETPEDVAHILAQQADEIRRQMEVLSESLYEIEYLKTEVLQMQSVDFKKYADIILNLQMKNEFYWLIKHFDDQTLDNIRNRFDKESSLAFMGKFSNLNKEILQLQRDGVPPDSSKGQAAAKAFWEMVTEFTGGNTDMLSKLTEMGSLDGTDDERAQNQALVNAYIETALDTWFTKLGVNPLEEDSENE